MSAAAAFPSGDLPPCAGHFFWWWASSCNALQWMSRSTSSWTRNALRASHTVSTWWHPPTSSCASTTLLWKPTWILWSTTNFRVIPSGWPPFRFWDAQRLDFVLSFCRSPKSEISTWLLLAGLSLIKFIFWPPFSGDQQKRTQIGIACCLTIKRRLCLLYIKPIQFIVIVTSISVATVGVVHSKSFNSLLWIIFFLLYRETRKKSRLNWEVHTNFNFERFKFSFITWKFRFTDVCLSFIKKLKKINS